MSVPPASAADPSFRRNQGRISYTWRDSGAQGLFMNACRLAAWRMLLERTGADRSRILDVGCSNGSWAGNWRELGFETLHGIEPNADEAAAAAEDFDLVHQGFVGEVAGPVEPAPVVAANGVIVHILEADAERAFLEAMTRHVAPGGLVVFSVLNCAYYPARGSREPSDGPVSCTRTLDHHRDLARRAGLTIEHEIGTFINPWCLEALDFVAGSETIKARPELWQGWELVSAAHRGETLVPFSEVLIGARLA